MLLPLSLPLVPLPLRPPLLLRTRRPIAVAAPTGPVASIEDVPVKAIDILLVVVAQKLKKRINKIQVLSKIIEDLEVLVMPH
jgi:3-oxoacyl-ACP reductase-like protein